MKDKDLIDVQEVAPAEVGEIDLYERREKIYTRKIEGFYQRIRLYTGWPLLATSCYPGSTGMAGKLYYSTCPHESFIYWV
jgi:hypothetical protein